MTTNTTNYWGDNVLDHSKAFVCALLCQQAYTPTGNINLDQYQTAIGATERWSYSGNTYFPAVVIYTLPDRTKIASFAGSATLRQVIAYWLQGGMVQNARMVSAAYIYRFLNLHYGDDGGVVKNELLRGSSPGNPNKIVVCGHSVGGAYASLIASDLFKNSATRVNLVNGYYFGTPTFCDTYFVNNGFFESNFLQYSYGCGDDPILNVGAGRYQVFRQYNSPILGAPSVETITLATQPIGDVKLWLNDGQATRQANWNVLPNSRVSRFAAEFLGSGGLPHDHSIAAYSDALLTLLQRSRNLRGTSTSLTAQIVGTANSVVPTAPPPQSTIPIGQAASSSDLGLGGDGGDWSDAPAGGTTNIVPGVAQYHGTARPAPQWQQNSNFHVRVLTGDGRARRTATELLEMIQHLRVHDSNVDNGVHLGSKFIFNAANAPVDLEKNIGELEDYLTRKVV